MELEQNLLSHIERALSTVSIRLLLETRLGVLELRAQQVSVCGPVQVTRGRVDGQHGAEVWKAAQVGFYAVERLERGALQRRVVGRVVPKL